MPSIRGHLTGVEPRYLYRRIEDAHYARKVEIRSSIRAQPVVWACNTIDEFTSALGKHDLAAIARHHLLGLTVAEVS
jgi:hypothetical protein